MVCIGLYNAVVCLRDGIPVVFLCHWIPDLLNNANKYTLGRIAWQQSLFQEMHLYVFPMLCGIVM